MENNSLKNIFIIFTALVGLTILATLIVLGFNSIVGLSTDMNNEDVATSIAAIAFLIALGWKYLFEKSNKN